MSNIKEISIVIESLKDFLNNPTVASIFGAIAGGFLTYKTTVNIAKRQEFNNAACQYRNAFLPERMLLDVRHTTEDAINKSAMEIIEPAIHRHAEAMFRFREHLPWHKKILLNMAWSEYAHYKVKGEPDYRYLAMYNEETWEGKNTKELAKKRINKLLKYAKPK